MADIPEPALSEAECKMGGLWVLFRPGSPGRNERRSSCYNPMPAAGRALFGDPSAVEGRWQLPMSSGKAAGSARRRGAMHGGFRRRRFSWGCAFHGVRHMGGISEQPLHLRPLHLTILFAGDLRRFPTRAVGPEAAWYPSFLPFSPALFILWIPGLFRLTCYYYRGAYYKSFWADPPACAVSEPRKTYLGERSFPLILQNFHRYFLRLSYLVWGFLVYDAMMSFRFPEWFRNRDRKPRSGGECRAAGRIHIRLSRVPAPGRRDARPDLGTPRPAQALRLRELPEPRRTSGGRGRVCSGWHFPISTSASARWASGMTGESCRCRNSSDSLTTYW